MGRATEWKTSRGPRPALRYYRKDTGIVRATWNVFWLEAANWVPWFGIKNALLRLTGMKVGRGAAVAFRVQPDILFPHDIELGPDVTVGYNTTILCHGYLRDRYERGAVHIREGASIGADCMILAGVVVGAGAVVAAKSLVNQDVPPGELWGGVPAKRLGTVAEHFGSAPA